MAFDGSIIDIFVSSPGDVATYRDQIIRIVQAWNQRNGRSRKLFFNCLRWEDLVSPDISDSGQDVINDQVGDEYDIFLGVMWAKFGTATLSADSGTQEEFDRAFNRHKSGEDIKVSFLFCTADVPMVQLDGSQYSKVQEFKKLVQTAGCLTRDFIDEATLINAINLILDHFANNWKPPADKRGGNGGSSGRNGGGSETDPDSNDPSAQQVMARPAINDDGILDVSERFNAHTERFSSILADWSSRFANVDQATSAATGGLSQAAAMGRPDPSQVKAILNPMTEALEGFASWCENAIPELEQVSQNLSSDALRIIELSGDFESSDEEERTALAGFSELVTNIDGANGGLAGFVSSLEGLPRLDKKLNKACRRLIDVHKRLMAQNDLMKDNIILGMSDLTKRISGA